MKFINMAVVVPGMSVSVVAHVKAISAPGGGSAEWRLHMGYDPHTCQFTDFELTDSRDAERLDRFAQTADEIRIADRGFGSRPECIR